MSAVGLLLVGAVLFVNGLVFLGRADARGAAVVNLFVGAFQTFAPVWLLAHDTSPDAVLGAAATSLFGLTYLWAGVNGLTGADGRAFGWFCFWVAGMTVFFAGVSALRGGDPNQAVIWLTWGFLWAAFGRVLALGNARIAASTGWLAIVLSVWTCTVPALLGVLGWWALAPWWTSLALAAVTAVVVAALARTAPPAAPPTADAAGPAAPAAPADAGAGSGRPVPVA